MLPFLRSLRHTRFLAPSRFRFSHHLSLGITASSSWIRQDPNPLPVTVRSVLPSSVFLTQNHYHFRSRFYSKKSFSRRRENAPTSTVKEVEKQKHDTFRLLSARKVYVIVGAQLLLTLTVSSAVICSDSLMQFVLNDRLMNSVFLVLLWPLAFHYEKYPLNLISLGALTFCFSLTISPAVSAMQGEIIFASLALTTAIVSSFAGFVFWAAKKGYTDIWYRDLTWKSGLIVFILSNEFGFAGTVFCLATRGLNLLAWVVAQNDFEYDKYAWDSFQIYLGIVSMFWLLVLVQLVFT